MRPPSSGRTPMHSYARLATLGSPAQPDTAMGGTTVGPWEQKPAEARVDEGGWLSGPSVTVVDPKKIARVLGPTPVGLGISHLWVPRGSLGSDGGLCPVLYRRRTGLPL